MKSFQEINSVIYDLSKQKQSEIKPIEIKYDILIDKTIENNLPFIIGQIIKYNCKGSGYIGKYLGIENCHIKLSICTKSGVDKNLIKKFWWNEFDRMEKIL